MRKPGQRRVILGVESSEILCAEIPAHSSVGFSDEAFYCGYICGVNGCITHKCISGTEEYYIKKEEEPLPGALVDKFDLSYKINEYEIYKKKN